LISGLPYEVLSSRFQLHEPALLLAKPFSARQLAACLPRRFAMPRFSRALLLALAMLLGHIGCQAAELRAIGVSLTNMGNPFFTQIARGVAWRGVAWRGVAWRGAACCPQSARGSNDTIAERSSVELFSARQQRVLPGWIVHSRSCCRRPKIKPLLRAQNSAGADNGAECRGQGEGVAGLPQNPFQWLLRIVCRGGMRPNTPAQPRELKRNACQSDP